MASEQDVSAFVVDMCWVKSQPNYTRFNDWLHNVENNDTANVLYTSELDIDTVLSDAEDDPHFVTRYDQRLAVSSRHRLPPHLPATFGGRVAVYEIREEEFPGCVSLYGVGQLHRIPSDDGGDDGLAFESIISARSDDFTYMTSHSGLIVLRSMRCLEWPRLAAEWPTRERSFGWPDAYTIDRVVNRACDVAPKHSAFYRGGDQMFHAWEFVFPDAETILLNTWMPLQQIVYHVLRIVVRQEFAQYKCHERHVIISRQLLKAAMLWTSEKISVDSWTRWTVVRSCAAVMQLISQCHERQDFKGYFVESSNWFDCHDCRTQSETIAEQLRRFTTLDCLTRWMIDNYVRRCLENSSPDIAPLLRVAMDKGRLLPSMKLAVTWRNSMAVTTKFRNVKSIVCLLPSTIELAEAESKLNLRSVVSWRKDFLEIDQRFDGYFTSVVCLTMATAVKVNLSAIPDHVCDIVAAMVTSIDKSNKMSVVQKSDSFQLKKATYLLRLSLQSPCHVTSSILLVLAHAYLRRAQRIASMTIAGNSICQLSYVYLAALYYAEGRYKAAESLCERLASSRHQTSNERSNMAEGQHLHNIDDDTDVVSGVILLYQFVLNATLGCPNETSRADVFNAELFARHLRFVIRSASGKKIMTSYLVRRYIGQLRGTRTLSCGDLMIYYFLCRKKKSPTFSLQTTKRHSRAMRFGAREMRRLLVEFAVEQITQFQQLLSRDYCPDGYAIAATDIKAMYAAQSGNYWHSYRLSDENVNHLWEKSGFYEMPISGCMTHVMDDALASLSGVFVLVAGWYHQWNVSQVTLSLHSVVHGLLRMDASRRWLLVNQLPRLSIVHRVVVSRNIDRIVLKFAYRRAFCGLRNLVDGRAMLPAKQQQQWQR